LKKEKQKTLAWLSRPYPAAHAEDQKFFGSFFRKELLSKPSAPPSHAEPPGPAAQDDGRPAGPCGGLAAAPARCVGGVFEYRLPVRHGYAFGDLLVHVRQWPVKAIDPVEHD
jgi:hypothetical protein